MGEHPKVVISRVLGGAVIAIVAAIAGYFV